MSIDKSKTGPGWIADVAKRYRLPDGTTEQVRMRRTALAGIYEVDGQMQKLSARDAAKHVERLLEKEIGQKIAALTGAAVFKAHGKYKTIAELVEQWLRRTKKNGTESTVYTYSVTLDRFLEWCSERHILYAHQFTDAHAQGYYDTVLKECVGQGVTSRFNLAKYIFDFEVKSAKRVIERNPFISVERERVETLDDVTWLEDDLVQILDLSMATDEQHFAYQFLIEVGTRVGEFLNLPLAHCKGDFYLIAPHATSGKLWKPKTPKSKRRIPKSDKALEAEEFFRKRTKGQYLFAPKQHQGIRPAHAHWFTYTFETIRRRAAKNFPDYAEHLLKKRPGDRNWLITPHAYRGTFASRLLQEGRSLKEVGDLLGHSHVYMTERYAHLAPENLREAIKSLNSRKVVTVRVTPQTAKSPILTQISEE